MINDITQNISPVTALPGLLAANRPEAVNQLVEEELPLLSTELETLVGQLNDFVTETNQTATDVEANKKLAEQSAIVATSLANFQGAWSNIVAYTKGQSVESTIGSKVYYVSKVDSNLNHAVTDTNYWTYSPINDKVDKTINSLAAKTTPVDADLVYLGDSASTFGLKKSSWENIKATLISSFGALISGLTAKATPVNADMIVIADSAATNASKKVTLSSLKTYVTPDAASETTKGIVELATNAETITGTDTTRAITPAGLMSAFNKTGTAPMFACRAWVNFNGTGTVAIRERGNVSSITDNGVGNYTVNFATAMPNADYSISGTCGNADGMAYGFVSPYSLLTTSFKIENTNQDGNTIDRQYVLLNVSR